MLSAAARDSGDRSILNCGVGGRILKGIVLRTLVLDSDVDILF